MEVLENVGNTCAQALVTVCDVLSELRVELKIREAREELLLKEVGKLVRNECSSEKSALVM